MSDVTVSPRAIRGSQRKIERRWAALALRESLFPWRVLISRRARKQRARAVGTLPRVPKRRVRRAMSPADERARSGVADLCGGHANRPVLAGGMDGMLRATSPRGSARLRARPCGPWRVADGGLAGSGRPCPPAASCACGRRSRGGRGRRRVCPRVKTPRALLRLRGGTARIERERHLGDADSIFEVAKLVVARRPRGRARDNALRVIKRFAPSHSSLSADAKRFLETLPASEERQRAKPSGHSAQRARVGGSRSPREKACP